MFPPFGIKYVNYYFITDERSDLHPAHQAQAVINEGIRMVQYRNKSLSSRKMYLEALQVKRICENRAIFIVNDRVDIALAADADGVHLGQDDIPLDTARELIGSRILGASTHNMEQAADAEGVADYIGIGPIHSTETKEDIWPPLGMDKALDIACSVNIPTATIGGVEEKDIFPLSQGFNMICSLSAVTQKGCIGERAKLFEETFKMAKEMKHDTA